MKTRTIFNILGPLINPARPNIELMGVYSKDLVRPIAQTMLQMGLKRAAWCMVQVLMKSRFMAKRK